MTLLYFAWVRQKIGKSEEKIDLPPGASPATLRALIAFLRTRGRGYAVAFADETRIRAAVNHTHCALDTAIAPGDEIAFFPPVTGG